MSNQQKRITKTKKIHNVFLTLRFTIDSKNKTEAVKEATKRVYESDHDGTIISSSVSVLNKKTNKWSKLYGMWYDGEK